MKHTRLLGSDHRVFLDMNALSHEELLLKAYSVYGEKLAGAEGASRENLNDFSIETSRNTRVFLALMAKSSQTCQTHTLTSELIFNACAVYVGLQTLASAEGASGEILSDF